jgi:hypothetical protein
MRYTLAYFLVAFFCMGPAWAQDDHCRAQILLECGKDCRLSDALPADVELNFKKKTGGFCRGESCSSGKLLWKDQVGQSDGRQYRVFTLSDSGSILVSGAIDVRSNTFFALTSDVGTLFGRCQ